MLFQDFKYGWIENYNQKYTGFKNNYNFKFVTADQSEKTEREIITHNEVEGTRDQQT